MPKATPSQRRAINTDGSVTLSLEAGGKTEILAWLYGFVPHVEVLEPLALREAFVCSNRNRMLVGNARSQKETPPNRWGF